MPIQTWIDASQRRARFVVSGHFSMDEIRTAMHEIVSAGDFEPGFDILSDHTTVTGFLTPDQARGMVHILKAHEDAFVGTRWAAVTSEPASYGMLRVVGALMEPHPMRLSIFDSFDAAEAWLADD